MFSPEHSLLGYTAVLRNKNTHRFFPEEQRQQPTTGDVYSLTVANWRNHAPRSNHVSSSHFWPFFFPPSPLASVATESAKTPTSYQDIYIRGNLTNFKRGKFKRGEDE